MSKKVPITVAHGDRIGPEMAFYKAPITSPQGGGCKSLNVTTRKRLGLCAGIEYQKVTGAGYDIVTTESLRNFDGKQGFTLAQSQ